MLELFLARGQVEPHFSERAQDSILRHSDDGVLAILRRAERPSHIKIEPTLDRLLADIHRCDDLAVGRRLKQGSQTLLTIKHEKVRLNSIEQANSFNRPWMKLGFAARLQHHERSDWE
jgi:hypothetical protein